jgi:hypothetical protein
MAIRQASKRDRDHKIAKFQIKDRDDKKLHIGLEDQAACFLSCHFPKAEEPLRRHLIESVLLRQKRFLYRKSKRKQVKMPMFTPVPDISIPSAAPPMRMLTSEPSIAAPQERTKSEALASKQGTALSSQNTASAFDERAFDPDPSQSTPRPSSVISVQQDKRMDWPPPPKRTSPNVEVECPYCFDFLTDQELLVPDLWRFEPLQS